MAASPSPAKTFSVAPQTSLGPVSLAVSDVKRSEVFYRDTLGLQSQRTPENALTFSADGVTPLLTLTELPGARPQPRRSTGLYHFALLLPSRQDLAQTLQRLVAARYPLTGASDHLVSEALYLDDPDGNGIEIYRDRPRSEWNYDGDAIRMVVDPLDLRVLLDEATDGKSSPPGIAAGTTIGHVHLHVSDIASSKAFYHGVLGFDIMTEALPGALFVSAGGYHHHLGLNVWAGVGAPPAPRRFRRPAAIHDQRAASGTRAPGLPHRRRGNTI